MHHKKRGTKIAMPDLTRVAAPSTQDVGAKKGGSKVHAELEHLRTAASAAAGGDALSAPAVIETLKKLSDVEAPATVRRSLETLLRNLREDVRQLPESLAALSDEDVSKYLRDVDKRIVPDEKMRSKCLDMDGQPHVAVVGSFLLQLWTPESGADLAISAPKRYFVERDVANYKYHAKRVSYLARIARYLQVDCANQWDVEISAHGRPSYSPALVVRSPTVKAPIRVLVAMEGIPARLLARSRRNVRERGESSAVDDEKLGTAYYNATIAMDSALHSHLRTLHTASAGAPSFTHAVRLLRAWCVRRRLIRGSFVPASIIASSLSNKRAPRSASAAHLLRVALTRIAGDVLATLEMDNVRVGDMMDKGLCRRMRQEAKAALVALDSSVAAIDPWGGALSSMFVTARGAEPKAVPVATLFDAFVRVQAVEAEGRAQIEDGNFERVLHSALVETRRVACIERIDDGLYGVEISSYGDATRKVDLCGDDLDVEQFKKFWGGRTQLRRFRDGSIKQAVVWDGEANTLQQIVSHAVGRHLHTSVNANVVFGQLENVKGMNNDDEATSLSMHAALNELGKTMRSLEGLPLRVVRISGVSSQLRRASVTRSKGKGVVEAIEVVAFFESSNSWPKDAVAISASKAAFYVALRDALAGKGLQAHATISSLEVSLGGFPFTLRLVVEDEHKSLDDASVHIWQTDGRVAIHSMLRNAGRTQPALAAVCRVAKRWLSVHLLFTQLGDRASEWVELIALRAVQGPNARVVKSSLAGFARFLHLLAEYPWETAPLIVSTPPPEDDNDGEIDGLVDPREELQYKDAFREFERRANSRPMTAITVDCARPYDWFQRAHAPPTPIAKRVVVAARAALVLIEQVLEGEKPPNALSSTLYRTPVNGVYDLVIELKKHRKMVGLDPVERFCESVRASLGEEAWFMRDGFGASNLVYVGWRPYALKSRAFSIKNMRFATPVGNQLVGDRRLMVEEIRRLGFGLIEEIRFLKEDNMFPESMASK